jgi:nitrate reductase NapE component
MGKWKNDWNDWNSIQRREQIDILILVGMFALLSAAILTGIVTWMCLLYGFLFG